MAGTAVLPVGDYNFLLKLEVLIGDGEVDELAVVHDVHVLKRMAAQLREGGGGLSGVALFAHYEFAVRDLYGLVLKIILEGGGSHLGYGHGTVVKLIGFRHEFCALHVDVGLSLDALPAQHSDSFVHSAFFHGLSSYFCIVVAVLVKELYQLVQVLL